MRKFSKYLSVDINETFDVRVDSDTVIEFLQQCSAEEYTEIIEEVGSRPPTDHMSTKTMNDLLKYELLVSAFNKYTLTELEARLK